MISENTGFYSTWRGIIKGKRMARRDWCVFEGYGYEVSEQLGYSVRTFMKAMGWPTDQSPF